MPVYIDPVDGFPLWGNPSPQHFNLIPGGQVKTMIEDAKINQVPGGSAEEVSLIFKQRPASKQAQAQGISANNLEEVGKFGSDLFQRFMSYYEPPDQRTP